MWIQISSGRTTTATGMGNSGGGTMMKEHRGSHNISIREGQK